MVHIDFSSDPSSTWSTDSGVLINHVLLSLQTNLNSESAAFTRLLYTNIFSSMPEWLQCSGEMSMISVLFWDAPYLPPASVFHRLWERNRLFGLNLARVTIPFTVSHKTRANIRTPTLIFTFNQMLNMGRARWFDPGGRGRRWKGNKLTQSLRQNYSEPYQVNLFFQVKSILSLPKVTLYH